MGRILAIAAALAMPVWLLASSQDRQTTPPPKHSIALDAWRQAVLSHTPGQRDAAVALIRTWSAPQLDDVLSEFERTRAALDASEVDRILERGALLHADIAILAQLPDGTYDLPSDGRSIAIIKDGEEVRHVGGTFHWAFARRLLDALPRTRARDVHDEYARAWYRATAAALQSWEDHAELGPHLQRAFTRFPNDANLLLIEGAMHARFAGPRFQQVRGALSPISTPARPDSSQPAPGVSAAFDTVIQPADEERQLAESAFREALKADPALVEAHIRLGDILGDEGHHTQALDQIEQALARPLPDLFRYDASLIAGREQEALGRVADARASYEQATALFPRARTARLASSRLLRDAGDRDGASRLLDALADPDASTDDDPWWRYDDTHVPTAQDLLAGLPQFLDRP